MSASNLLHIYLLARALRKLFLISPPLFDGRPECQSWGSILRHIFFVVKLKKYFHTQSVLRFHSSIIQIQLQADVIVSDSFFFLAYTSYIQVRTYSPFLLLSLSVTQKNQILKQIEKVLTGAAEAGKGEKIGGQKAVMDMVRMRMIDQNEKGHY